MTAFWASKICSNSNKNRNYKQYFRVQKPGKKFSPKTAFLDTLTLTLTDDKTVAKARAVTEKYWNAQKTSDGELFLSVTPHDRMQVVFGWSFVKQSAITVEEGSIAPIRDNFQQFVAFRQRYESLSHLAPGKVEALGAFVVSVLLVYYTPAWSQKIYRYRMPGGSLILSDMPLQPQHDRGRIGILKPVVLGVHP